MDRMTEISLTPPSLRAHGAQGFSQMDCLMLSQAGKCAMPRHESIARAHYLVPTGCVCCWPKRQALPAAPGSQLLKMMAKAMNEAPETAFLCINERTLSRARAEDALQPAKEQIKGALMCAGCMCYWRRRGALPAVVGRQQLPRKRAKP